MHLCHSVGVTHRWLLRRLLCLDPHTHPSNRAQNPVFIVAGFLLASLFLALLPLLPCCLVAHVCASRAHADRVFFMVYCSLFSPSCLRSSNASAGMTLHVWPSASISRGFCVRSCTGIISSAPHDPAQPPPTGTHTDTDCQYQRNSARQGE